MSSKATLSKRIVKGKTYFYLDKNMKTSAGKWKKVSVYLGSKKPKKMAELVLKEIKLLVR